MPDDEREIEILPEHESPLRHMAADASGTEYVAYETLADARHDPDGALVMEGDWGGQIYLACPVSAVAVDEATVRALFRDISDVGWGDEGAGLRFERKPVGSGVLGGMGGGQVSADIWVHPEYVLFGLADAIRAILRGQRDPLTRDEIDAAKARSNEYVRTL